MSRLTVFRLSEIALPAAWLIWGAGFLPGALTVNDAENVSWFHWAAIAGLLLTGTTWLVRRRLTLAENAGWHSGLVVMLVLATALGMMVRAVQPIMLAAALTGLAWWDLADFTLRLKQFGRGDSPEVDLLVSVHMRRLALALGIGLVSGVAALSITVKLTLEGAMLLGALAVFLIRAGIGRTLRGQR